MFHCPLNLSRFSAEVVITNGITDPRLCVAIICLGTYFVFVVLAESAWSGKYPISHDAERVINNGNDRQCLNVANQHIEANSVGVLVHMSTDVKAVALSFVSRDSPHRMCITCTCVQVCCMYAYGHDVYVCTYMDITHIWGRVIT